jgi:hypothetical protein
MQVSDDRFQAESGWNFLSKPNRQRKYINIGTPEKHCTKQTRQYGTTKHADKNSLHQTTYALK